MLIDDDGILTTGKDRFIAGCVKKTWRQNDGILLIF